MKNIRYVLFLAACFVLIPFNIHAQDMEFILFDSDITVNKNRTLDIQENYRVYFINDVDSIERKINTKVTEVRPDNTSLVIDSKIANIKQLLLHYKAKDFKMR
jgi:hypothetical protein